MIWLFLLGWLVVGFLVALVACHTVIPRAKSHTRRVRG